MNGAEPEVDVHVKRLSVPLPAGIWSETGPEIDIEAVMYSAVGSVNSKKSSNVWPLPGVFVLGNETLSFRIEPRFVTVIVARMSGGGTENCNSQAASVFTRTFVFITHPSPR